MLIFIFLSCVGELIHIDFGILFDRGETLSIPEVVPFRLTRDIVNGLGPMALEGVFRATCELTLDVCLIYSTYIQLNQRSSNTTCIGFTSNAYYCDFNSRSFLI
jgi:hypothetical protein